MAVRMPNAPSLSNPDDHKISIGGNQSEVGTGDGSNPILKKHTSSVSSYIMPNIPDISNPDNRTISVNTNQYEVVEGSINENGDSSTYSILMPNVPAVTNPDDHTIVVDTNMLTSILIDDSTIDIRKTWSSAKISTYAEKSGQQRVDEYTDIYGDLFFSEYDSTVYDEWTDVIRDAISALENGEQFFVAWSETRSAQVIDADLDSEPRMTVIIDGRSYAMSDVGIVEVPIYNIVIQCDNRNNFPEIGTKDRLYIDTSDDCMYYWKESIGYTRVNGEHVLSHKLTFGADQEYVFDGSEDVTVPVYMGELE